MALKDIEKLKEKVEKDPNSKLFVPLAEEYKKEGMLDEAIQVLLTGIERQPGYMSARVSLGKIYLEKGMRNEARTEFESVIKSIPDNLYAHKKLAEIYRESGEKELAVRAYRTILRLNSMDEDALSCLHELEEGNLQEDAIELPTTGVEASSEEDLLEGHIHEAPSEEVPADDSHLDDFDAGLSESAQDVDLNAFKESLFGSGDSGDSIPEDIIAQDLDEEDAMDSAFVAGEDVAGDVSEDVVLEEAAPVMEEIPREEEETVVSEGFPEGGDAASAGVYTAETAAVGVEGATEVYSVAIGAADSKVAEGDYVGAIRIYREILSDNPDDRKALQRLEELSSLLKMMGKDKEELIARLSGFLEGIRKRHNEFLGRT